MATDEEVAQYIADRGALSIVDSTFANLENEKNTEVAMVCLIL